MTNVIARLPRATYLRVMKKHVFTAVLLSLFVVAPVFAHCDWTRGPVVLDAQSALEKGDLAPVLKWIPAESEKEVRDAFARTLSVRKAGGEAQELADRWFFETVVRLHRQSEGAPFNGLRGDEYTPDPAIVLAEKALEQGSLEAVQKSVGAELKKRFEEAMHAKEHAAHNANAGRHYVHAYAEFVHYVLRAHQATGTGEHQD